MGALLFFPTPLLFPLPPQGGPSPGPGIGPGSVSLPKPCLALGESSPKIAEIQQVLAAQANADAFNALGALYAQSGNLNCAIAAFKGSLRLDSKSWQTQFNLGLALIQQGNHEEAATHLQEAIRGNPDSSAAHVALGSVLSNQGHLDEAAPPESTSWLVSCRPLAPAAPSGESSVWQALLPPT